MDLNPETTLCIIVSKSFTTRATMMNASFIREWLISHYKCDEKCLTSHFIAISANPTLPTQKFGVDKENIFEFWDWVGGRYRHPPQPLRHANINENENKNENIGGHHSHQIPHQFMEKMNEKN